MPTGRRHLVVGAIGIAQILSWGASYYLPAILARPIVADTGWPFAWVVGGITIGLLTAGLAAVRVGHRIERHGGRPVLAASALLLTLGLVILGLSPSLPGYLLGWAVMGLGMAGGLYDAAFSTLGRIFGDQARRAITHLTLWGGFASTVCWPISAILVETVGWRGTCLAYAAIHLCIVLPLYVFGVPREKARTSARAASTNVSPGDTPPDRRALAFAILAAMLTINGTVSAVWAVHIVTILQAGGIGLAAAVALGTLVGPAQVGGRVVEMLTGGRYHPIWTQTAAVILCATGLVLLWAGLPLPALALIAYGAGNGIHSIARGTVPLALFGAGGYAVMMGRLATPSLIAQAAAPAAGAVLLDAFGADATLGTMAGLALANVLAVVILRWVALRP